MSLKMVPVASIFKRMKRFVFEYSRQSHKKINLILTDQDNEIDKMVAEKLTDPLVHLVRNALDHGIEMPDERKQAGKNETGELRIEARQEDSEFQIIIEDDGRGLSRDKILSKGIERGLLSENDPGLSDDQLFELIFSPGFSTAETITDISGRGVGMDVVKKNIEALNGRIDIQSEEGKGAMFSIQIPHNRQGLVL